MGGVEPMPFRFPAAAVEREIAAAVESHRLAHAGCPIRAIVSNFGDDPNGPLACWLTGDGGVEVTVWAWGVDPIAEVVVCDAVDGHQVATREHAMASADDFVTVVAAELAALL